MPEAGYSVGVAMLRVCSPSLRTSVWFIYCLIPSALLCRSWNRGSYSISAGFLKVGWGTGVQDLGMKCSVNVKVCTDVIKIAKDCNHVQMDDYRSWRSA